MVQSRLSISVQIVLNDIISINEECHSNYNNTSHLSYIEREDEDHYIYNCLNEMFEIIDRMGLEVMDTFTNFEHLFAT